MLAMKSTDCTLIQPRHPYVPAEGLGHVYMPSSLLTVGARLLAAGCEVEFQDLNFSAPRETAQVAGMNLVGCPNIPGARALTEEPSSLALLVSRLTPSV